MRSFFNGGKPWLALHNSESEDMIQSISVDLALIHWSSRVQNFIILHSCIWQLISINIVQSVCTVLYSRFYSEWIYTVQYMSACRYRQYGLLVKRTGTVEDKLLAPVWVVEGDWLYLAVGISFFWGFSQYCTVQWCPWCDVCDYGLLGCRNSSWPTR